MRAGSRVVVIVVGIVMSSAAGSSAAAPPSQLAPLVRYALLLEESAQHHQASDRGAAKVELAGSIAVLQQALATGPPRPVATSLRQALTKDTDALDLLSTVNQDKVRLDLVTAQNLKENALKALGEPLKGSAIPLEPGQKVVKPVPATPAKPKKQAAKPLPKPKQLTIREKTIKLVDRALDLENAAHTAFYQLDDPYDGYGLLGKSLRTLESALKVVQGDPKLFGAALEIWLAIRHDYEISAILIGFDDGCVRCEAENAYDHKLNALEDMGVKIGKTTFRIDLASVFVPKELATKYTVSVVPYGHAKLRLRYEWALALELVDPPGVPLLGNPDSGAAFDPTCNNAHLRGGKPLASTRWAALYVWENLTGEFTWYHGDPGAYPGSNYGCDHHKMGPSGHQGIVSVTISDGIWSCSATLDGSNLGSTPAVGDVSPCLFLPS